MKVITFGDFLHHVVDHTNFDSESDLIKAHELIEQQFPQPADPTVAATSETVAEPEATSLPQS